MAYHLVIGRIIASFVSAVLLAFVGDVIGRVLNLLLGYPWSQEVHLNIHLVTIGLVAGTGAVSWWVTPSLGRYWVSVSAVVALLASVGGVYIGKSVGPGVDPYYWWSRFATDNTLYLSAAICGVITATVIGFMGQFKLIRRENSSLRPSTVDESGPKRTHLE